MRLALFPFVPGIALVLLALAIQVPGLQGLALFGWIAIPLALATTIVLSVASVVPAMREARDTGSRWAWLLPVPSLVCAAILVPVLRDMLLWIATR